MRASPRGSRPFGIVVVLLWFAGTAAAQSAGRPPNLYFVIDTSGSMRELPQIKDSSHYNFFADTVNGCENPDLDAFSVSKGWDPNVYYPFPDEGTGLGADMGYPELFRDDKYYAYMNWADWNDPHASSGVAQS